MRLTLCVATIAALFGAHVAIGETRKAPAPSGPCAAAVAPVNYGRLVKIPDAVKAEVEAYRQGWKDACARKSGTSLAALLARGDRIGKGLAAAVDKSGIKEARYEELHELWQKIYPRFIPAFQGSMIEYEYIEPDLAVFARHAALGDADDKLFLGSRRALFGNDGHAFPWIRRSWDHGGCVRWGQYDWVAAVVRIEGLAAKLTAEAYRTRLGALENRIRNYLTDPAAKRDGKKPVVDSCATRAQTIAAIDKTMRGLQARKGWQKTAAGLKRTLDDIRTNRTEICNDCLR